MQNIQLLIVIKQLNEQKGIWKLCCMPIHNPIKSDFRKDDKKATTHECGLQTLQAIIKSIVPL